TPEREALLELATGRRYTYAELNIRANQVANFLRQRLGVQKGDRVSLLAHNSVVYVDLLYGLAKIGAIFAPLNWRLAAAELTYILGDCRPQVLIVGPEFAGVLDAMRPQLDIHHYVSLEGAPIDDAWIYEDELAAAAADEPERPPLDPEDPA